MKTLNLHVRRVFLQPAVDISSLAIVHFSWHLSDEVKLLSQKKEIKHGPNLACFIRGIRYFMINKRARKKHKLHHAAVHCYEKRTWANYAPSIPKAFSWSLSSTWNVHKIAKQYEHQATQTLVWTYHHTVSTKDIAQATSSTFLPGIVNQSYGSTQPPASASEGTHSKIQDLRACFNNW